DAGLGLNPMTDGNLIRIPIPELSGERRQELTKVAGRYAEQARVAIRNIRRDAMDGLKKAEKDSEISQDDQKLYSDEIQSLTNKYVGEVDETAKQKEAEILQV
ncbi:MAG: ribosome-recycling factor, partial [Alphaproteobacteria bacterium]